MKGRGRKAPEKKARRREAPLLETILYRVDGPAAWITLNRPEKKNALAGTMREDLLRRIREAEADPSVQIGRAHV